MLQQTLSIHRLVLFLGSLYSLTELLAWLLLVSLISDCGFLFPAAKRGLNDYVPMWIEEVLGVCKV